MTRLSDIHRIFLSTASQRENGSLLPLPDAIGGDDKRKAAALETLRKRGFAEIRGTTDQAGIYRSTNGGHLGLFVTDAGLAAIGCSNTGWETAPEAVMPPAPRLTKSSIVLDLMRREGGATLAELIAATGWLPHTTRAALTGLRKRSHRIERSKRGDTTCYRVVA